MNNIVVWPATIYALLGCRGKGNSVGPLHVNPTIQLFFFTQSRVSNRFILIRRQVKRVGEYFLDPWNCGLALLLTCPSWAGKDLPCAVSQAEMFVRPHTSGRMTRIHVPGEMDCLKGCEPDGGNFKFLVGLSGRIGFRLTLKLSSLS
jgi:hypothetical protein